MRPAAAPRGTLQRYPTAPSANSTLTAAPRGTSNQAPKRRHATLLIFEVRNPIASLSGLKKKIQQVRIQNYDSFSQQLSWPGGGARILPHGSTDGLETPRGACRTGDVRKLHPTSTDNGTLMLVCEYFPKRGSQKRNKRYMNPTNHGIFWVIWGWNPMFLGS